MEKRIYTVSDISSYILNMFTQDILLRSVYVKGEVSGVTYHSTGHIYFTLKDKSGALSAVMFAGNRKEGLKFKLEEGQEVVCQGTVTTYAGQSKYQIKASKIELQGAGDIYEQYEKLKKELEELGMFSEMYKKPIPKYAKKIGIITAPTGHAIHDIITTTKRRNPYVQLYLFPVTVQGNTAVQSIVHGIKEMDKLGMDVLIVGRGGGSVEDLFVFNDREIAQAIFDCNTPIVSAVGHEPDFFISDFVADLRAATPTASAELTVYNISELDEKFADLDAQLNGIMQNKINTARLKVSRASLMVEGLNPLNILDNKRMKLVHSSQQLSELMEKILNVKKHKYELMIEQMRALSPLEKLSKGYAFAQKDDKPLISVNDVKENETVTLYLKDGHINTKVTEIINKKLI